MALISDLHLQGFGRREEMVIERLQELKPDVIVIAGDATDKPDVLPIQIYEVTRLVRNPRNRFEND